jgi:aminoglycoside phosphotransferase (APT) family kinase protein
MSHDHVRAVLARWFPDWECVISRAEAGVSTPVFRVLVGDESSWVRLGEEPGERRDGEVAAHRMLRAAGIPIPEVIRYEAAPPELDRSIALTSHLAGTPLADIQAGPWLPALAADAGRVLACINRISVRGFGWAYASEEEGVPVGVHRWRSGWTREYIGSVRVVRESGVLEAAAIDALEAAIERWTRISSDRATGPLAHGDFDTTHVYVDPESGKLTGVIDLGELRGADPLYDLGHLLLHDGEAGRPVLFPHILNGYAEISPLPDDAMDQIRLQALAIGTRALAIQLRRPPSPYPGWLVDRLRESIQNIRHSERNNGPLPLSHYVTAYVESQAKPT